MRSRAAARIGRRLSLTPLSSSVSAPRSCSAWPCGRVSGAGPPVRASRERDGDEPVEDGRAGHGRSVPKCSTLCRRRKTVSIQIPCRRSSDTLDLLADSTGVKMRGEGEWQVRRHGHGLQRQWRKVHLAMDTATQGAGFEYPGHHRAVARGSVRPSSKAAKAALRGHVQERLAGRGAWLNGRELHGPSVARKGRRAERRQDRRWAEAWNPKQIASRLGATSPMTRPWASATRATHQSLCVQGHSALKREFTACLRIPGPAPEASRSRRRGHFRFEGRAVIPARSTGREEPALADFPDSAHSDISSSRRLVYTPIPISRITLTSVSCQAVLPVLSNREPTDCCLSQERPNRGTP